VFGAGGGERVERLKVKRLGDRGERAVLDQRGDRLGSPRVHDRQHHLLHVELLYSKSCWNITVVIFQKLLYSKTVPVLSQPAQDATQRDSAPGQPQVGRPERPGPAWGASGGRRWVGRRRSRPDATRGRGSGVRGGGLPPAQRPPVAWPPHPAASPRLPRPAAVGHRRRARPPHERRAHAGARARGERAGRTRGGHRAAARRQRPGPTSWRGGARRSHPRRRSARAKARRPMGHAAACAGSIPRPTAPARRPPCSPSQLSEEQRSV
jgi:hypothetical protein